MSISTEARPAPTTTTVLIVDDHDLVAMSLALYLRSEGLLAQRHAARSRDGILTAAATMNPGVVLLDLGLPNGVADLRYAPYRPASTITAARRLAPYRDRG